MKISKQARRGAKELFRSTFANGAMDEGRVRQVVQKVIEAKPRGYVGILDHFQRLVKLEIDRRSARVESAVVLSPEQQTSIGAGLEQRYGRGLRTDFVTNPSLVGGMRVRVGSDVYDGSVQARLQRLADSF